MTITEQANAIVAALRDYVSSVSGHVAVVHDMKELWETAYNDSQSPTVLVHYGGEDARGDFSVVERLNMVDRLWNVMVKRGSGLLEYRGASLIEPNTTAPGYYDLVEQVRDTMRTIALTDCEGPIVFKGVRPMVMGEVVTDAYLLEFSIGTLIPQVTPRTETE